MSKEKEPFIPALQDTPTEVMYLQKKVYELEGRISKLEYQVIQLIQFKSNTVQEALLK